MSAILGLINLNQPIGNRGEILQDALMKFQFDAHETLKTEHLFFEAGLQFITPEDTREKLPYEDEELIMTADAIIDNREELISLLEVEESITDSQLIVSAYKRWKEACCSHLIGDYAFAIWDKQAQQLFCVRDHVGKRSFYYSVEDEGNISFATIMAPLVALKGQKAVLNEKWLTDFLTIKGVISAVDLKATIYEKIYELPPAHYLIFNREGIKVSQYWHPEKIKTLHLKNDAAYEKAFREVFDEAVRCRLRCKDEVGIMLSSGLDSTAVAAVAATILQKKGRKLLSFTEIPLPDYDNKMPEGQIVNEKDLIQDMLKMYPNIEANFNSYEQEHSYNHLEENINILEQPYKFVENFYWLRALFHEAAKKRCKVLLDGQFGNYSISKGNHLNYWNTLFKRLHFIQLAKAIHLCCKRNHLSRKKVYPFAIKSLCASLFAGIRKKGTDLQSEGGLANWQLVKRYDSLLRIKKAGYLFKEGIIRDCYENKRMITNLTLFAHLGGLESKCGLYEGIARRDPTRDKRVIEFCLSLPESQYVHEGERRSIIRRAMAQKVPDSIRLNFTKRGKQAADWQQRLIPYYQEIENELEAILANPRVNDYLDKEKITVMLNEWKKDKEDVYGSRLKELLAVIIFARSIRQLTPE